MSDNISLPQGPGTLLATDEVLGVHVIRAKVQIGADGTAEDVSSVNPLPVSLAAGTNTIGAVSLDPTISGGLSAYRRVGLNATGQLVKDSAGQVFGWYLSNTGAGGVFVKLYDLDTAPTVGSSVPVMTLYVPPGGVASAEHVNGISFSNGVGVAATTLVGDADTTAPASNAVIANLFYK